VNVEKNQGSGRTGPHKGGPPPGDRAFRAWQIAALSVTATLIAVAAAVSGYVVGGDAGEDLDQARAVGARTGRARATSEFTEHDRSNARREGRRSGYRIAYRRAFRTNRARVARGGPRNCGDAQVSDTPSIAKVRGENISCAAALTFARETRNCQGDTGTPCQGYSCTTVETNYEESEFTCRRGSVTIRFLSGV
jgi:hypothetical protein